jgi:phosphoenolpyruvate-protein kinase (PTS system EI component)
VILCGELAGEPLAAFLLSGLDGFSMVARSISLVKQTIRRYSSEQARDAQHVMMLNDAEAVKVYLKGLVC